MEPIIILEGFYYEWRRLPLTGIITIVAHQPWRLSLFGNWTLKFKPLGCTFIDYIETDTGN